MGFEGSFWGVTDYGPVTCGYALPRGRYAGYASRPRLPNGRREVRPWSVCPRADRRTASALLLNTGTLVEFRCHWPIFGKSLPGMTGHWSEVRSQLGRFLRPGSGHVAPVRCPWAPDDSRPLRGLVARARQNLQLDPVGAADWAHGSLNWTSPEWHQIKLQVTAPTSLDAALRGAFS
jgi:hypothetical protein